mmetsp:Transcript_3482/g.13469  ORF Transcript_3482/g.13469 Transcript_3482/m.13469 type:complete len:255 (+) Transcript_3482:767-1531(+)
MLHLYESFGWWRAAELRKVHGAEEYNELHHLLIMEALGGNARWSDRFLGYHVAVAYYWLLIGVYFFSPRLAYQFMELLEAHAVDTYGTFVRENRERLKALPPPTVARSYYASDDLYYFDDFQVSTPPGARRPPCDTLLDVFQNICEDEAEHVKTMRACQDYCNNGGELVSPHLAAQRHAAAALAAAPSSRHDEAASASSSSSSEDGERGLPQESFGEYVQGMMMPGEDADKTPSDAKRALWKEWADAVNDDAQH